MENCNHPDTGDALRVLGMGKLSELARKQF